MSIAGNSSAGRERRAGIRSVSAARSAWVIGLAGRNVGGALLPAWSAAGRKTPSVTQGPEMHVVVERRAETVQEGDAAEPPAGSIRRHATTNPVRQFVQTARGPPVGTCRRLLRAVSLASVPTITAPPSPTVGWSAAALPAAAALVKDPARPALAVDCGTATTVNPPRQTRSE